MRILQTGEAKSGNLWLYKILQNIIHCAGLENPSFIQNHPIHDLAKTWDLSYKEQADIDVLDIEPHQCFYRISSVFRMPIEDIDDYIHQCSHVWTHSLFCERSLSVLPKFDKVVYIIRDPRDVAISRSRFAFTPYMLKYYPHGVTDPDSFLELSLDGTVRRWVQHVGGYLKHKDDLHIYVVFYERLLRSFDTELSHLLRYLDIKLDEKAIDHIKREVDFTTMKTENPDHVRRGRSGEWAQLFTDEQKRQVVSIAGPMLKLLNYLVGEDQVNSLLPCLPAQLSSNQIEKAIAYSSPSHARSMRRMFMEKVKRIFKFIIEQQ